MRQRSARSAAATVESGFTLVELLVSLAILGLVASLLLSGLGTAALLATRGRQADSRVDEVIAAQSLLRTRLERLAPVLRLDSSTPIIDARGTTDSFDFIAPPIDRDQPDAFRRYRLTIGAGGDLILYSATVLDPRLDYGDKTMPGWTPLRLLRGVATLSIDYFGADPRGGRGWQSRWTSQPQPPDVIGIRITFPAGDRRTWPALLVRPHVTVNAACRIDNVSGRCGSST